MFADVSQTSKRCPRAFVSLQSQHEIQQFFSDQSNLNNFKNQKGYLRFCETYNYKSMSYLFKNVSRALGNQFKVLNWQQFQGSNKEFRAVRAEVLDKHGNFKKEYQGMEGQARFADKFYNGDMFKTFTNVSAVLNKRIFNQSGWQTFKGSTKEFRAVRAEVLDKHGNFKKEYQGMEGQARFADKFYNGDMFKTFMNVSAVLGTQVFKQSSWRAFKGSTKEFRAVRPQILDKHENFKKEYQGMEGQARFADKFYNGDMLKTFLNISAVLDKQVFKQSGWQQFQGSTKEFRAIKSQILDKHENFKEEYQGMEGQARFADKFYNGSMQKTFINVSAVFGGFRNIKLLKWKAFLGTSSQYRKLVQLFKDFSLEDLSNLSGQKKVAGLIFNDNVKKAYKNVSTLRDILFVNPKEDWLALKWSEKTIPNLNPASNPL